MASVRACFIVVGVLVGTIAAGGSVMSALAATAAASVLSAGDSSGVVGESVCVETADAGPFAPGNSLRNCPTPTPTPTAPALQGWSLAWSDEFSGSTIDRSKWNVLNNSTYGDGNGELACMMDRPENVRVTGGALVISARPEAGLKCGSKDARFPAGRSYSSAHLETKGKATFEYGRFEVRAKTPTAYGQSKGMWPAFWMRPADGGIGELDVFESMGSAAGERDASKRTEQTIHYDYVKSQAKQNRNFTLPSGTFAEGFHDYAVEWEPGAIRWYIDGVLTFERTKATTPWIDEAFSRDFYLRLNMAVGGPVGTPTSATVFPADFVVDHVRVYQRR